MKRVSVLFLMVAFFALAAVPLMLQGHGGALVTANQEPEAKFRKSAKSIPNQYIVVLKDDVPNVRSATADLARVHGGNVKLIYEHAIKGFSIQLPEPAAIALSKNPLVDHGTEDAEINLSATQFNPPWNLDRIDQRDLPLDSAYTYNQTG